MAFDLLKTAELIIALEAFLELRRPPVEIREKLDISYKIENQSAIIFEICPRWNKPDIKIESPVAKATFIRVKNHWKVFWMRADLKWHPFTPKPVVKTIHQFLQLVDEDKLHFFWG
jgi:hypothetical protein